MRKLIVMSSLFILGATFNSVLVESEKNTKTVHELVLEAKPKNTKTVHELVLEAKPKNMDNVEAEKFMNK